MCGALPRPRYDYFLNFLYKFGVCGVYLMEPTKNRLMKTKIRSAGLVIVIVGLVLGGCAKKKTTVLDSIKNAEIAARLKSFVAEKEAQAAKADRNGIAPQFKPFFSAAEKGDWLTMSNIFPKLQVRTGQAESQGKDDLIDLRGIQWETLKEIWGAFDEINGGDEKFATAFGNNIIESIPPKSIYFGGTDSGRFIVTALQKSHQNGDPFFTLTQNALADGSYLDYLRSMYEGKIYIPTTADSEKSFRDYTEDVARRQQNNQLKPGENVQVGQIRAPLQLTWVFRSSSLLYPISLSLNSRRLRVRIDRDRRGFKM